MADETTEAAVPAVSYQFYLDAYGGTASPEAFAECLSAATRLLRQLTGNAVVATTDAVSLLAYCRAICAAVDALAEFGEGSVAGYDIGDFKVTNYMGKGTTGNEVATAAALGELAGTGLAFCGVA
jgi:hypothetical protein